MGITGMAESRFAALVRDLDIALIPPKFARFLHPEPPPDDLRQSLKFYAYGYSEAFERLVADAADLYPHAGYLQAPIFYLARHAAELNLKAVINRFSDYKREE